MQITQEMMFRVFEDAADPIIIEDLEGHILAVNRQTVKLYGWPREELLGEHIRKIVPLERHNQSASLREACLAGEEVRDIEGLRVTRSGEVRDVLLTLSRLLNAQGEVEAIATICKDITLLKQTQARLHNLNGELELRVQQRTRELDEALEQLRQSKRELERELAVARALSEAANEGHELVLRGDSVAVRALREQVKQAAGREDPLLLAGPPGTRPESVARAIHKQSSREGAFIFVDCARLHADTTTPFATELKHRGASGKLVLAQGGTLYLEHVDKLSVENQKELMDFVQGGHEGLDARLVAYTSADLHQMSQEGHFLPELWAALCGNTLRLPSLLERREDIELLTRVIIEQRARTIGKLVEGIDADSLERLQAYSWPGNVDELDALLRRCVVMATQNQVEVSEEQLSNGPRVGGYRLEERVGIGGMGEVWRARHALLQRPAAVKLVRTETLHGQSQRSAALKRFQREARATSRLRSPHTVELYDFGVQHSGQFFYVMEYLHGMDLRQMIKAHGAIPQERAAYLLRQACFSLQEAHDQGLVHRDVKPGNLMACVLGPHHDFLKVLDFGIVKAVEDEGTQVTRTGMIAGTPAFLAPELAEQSGDPSPASDIYALGCIAYYLVVGREPYASTSIMSTLMAHMTKPVPRPSRANPRVSAQMDEIVQRCMAKNPSERPGSVLELLPALEALASPWTRARARAWWESHAPECLASSSIDITLEHQGPALD